MTEYAYTYRADDSIDLVALFEARMGEYEDIASVDKDSIRLAKMGLTSLQHRAKFTSPVEAELAIAIAEQIVVSQSGFALCGQKLDNIRTRTGGR